MKRFHSLEDKLIKNKHLDTFNKSCRCSIFRRLTILLETMVWTLFWNNLPHICSKT